MAVVVVATDGGFLDGAVHAFDLSVGPGVVGFCETMIDIVLRAGQIEGMGAEDRLMLDHRLDFRDAPAFASRFGEVGAVVGEDGVDFVGDDLDQLAQEVGCDASGGARVQFGIGELADPIDGHEHVELAVLGPDLGDVDVEIADRIGFELLARFGALDIGQATDVVTLEQPMQAGTGEMRDRRLECVEAIIPSGSPRSARSTPGSKLSIAVSQLGRRAWSWRCHEVSVP